MGIALKTVIENYLHRESSPFISLLHSYIEKNNPWMPLEESPTALESFLLYELPRHHINEDFHNEFHKFVQHMEDNYKLPLANPNGYNKIVNETQRLLLLKKQILGFMHLPLISKEPCVVDFLTYKRTHLPMENNYFSEGLFKAVDIYDNYGVIFKKISGQPMFVKIILSKEIIQYMKLSDILQLRITRNPSYYTWDILALKGCYLYHLEKNMNQRSYYAKR